MLIKNADQATEQAKKIIGNPVRFLPTECRKKQGKWRVKAIIGILDDIRITIEMPERLIGG